MLTTLQKHASTAFIVTLFYLFGPAPLFHSRAIGEHLNPVLRSISCERDSPIYPETMKQGLRRLALSGLPEETDIEDFGARVTGLVYSSTVYLAYCRITHDFDRSERCLDELDAGKVSDECLPLVLAPAGLFPFGLTGGPALVPTSELARPGEIEQPPPFLPNMNAIFSLTPCAFPRKLPPEGQAELEIVRTLYPGISPMPTEAIENAKQVYVPALKKCTDDFRTAIQNGAIASISAFNRLQLAQQRERSYTFLNTFLAYSCQKQPDLCPD